MHGEREGERGTLRALAEAAGILNEYYDASRHEVHRTSDATREAILHAMGYDVSTEHDAGRALEELTRAQRRLCRPVQVVRDNGAITVGIMLPPELHSLRWRMELQREDLTRSEAGGELDARDAPVDAGGWRTTQIELPWVLQHGYHDLRIVVRNGMHSLEGRQRLIVTPWSCTHPRVLLGERRAFGIAANLYTVRGAHDAGIGDVSTLDELVRWTRACGGAFVGVNPLHALRNRGLSVSPYSPSSRLFRSILYIDTARVPEMEQLQEAQQLSARANHNGYEHDTIVQYERILEQRLPVYRALHAAFREHIRNGASRRAEEYRAFCAEKGELLSAFAAFEFLGDEMLRSDGSAAADWRLWPDPERNAGSERVRLLMQSDAPDLDFHRYMQFELHQQLAGVQADARKRGMPIGLYDDLALGSAAGGFDTWWYRDLFVNDVSVGAPPDAFASEGQSWGFPAVAPRALEDSGFEYWVQLLRTAFEHSGMLRMDHVMGMWRQFWIPSGMSGREGAYVAYPAEAMLGILALESRRANAIVVGEDLGTVPEEVRPAMRERAMLSSRVLYFEKEGNGSFIAPEQYAELSIASANTHDLPSVAAWFLGMDISRRAELLPESYPHGINADLDHRRRERQMLLSRLREQDAVSHEDAIRLDSLSMGVWAEAHEEQELLGRLIAAVNKLLCDGASVLVSVALDDLALEPESVNLPGIPMETHASWSRRMQTPLAGLSRDIGCTRRGV